MLWAANGSITVDSLTNVIDGNVSPFNTMLPGDSLLLEKGNREFLLIRNLQGEPAKPIIIINSGGIVTINTDHYYGISIRNCRYIRLTGTGDKNGFYGFRIERVENGGGIGIGDESSDFEIDHFSIENCHGVGISAKTDPDCSFTNSRGKFTQYHTVLHDNYIANVNYEGMYIGSTKYFGQTVNCDGNDTLLLPSLLDGVRIYNNIIKYTGWDGIQVSSASSDCNVFDNLILFDSQGEFNNQMSGIMLGGGSKCDCYNNYIGQGKGTGIENHGLGGNRIFNNIIVDAGRTFLPLDSGQMRHGIFVSDITFQHDSSIYILNNDIINPKSDGIRFSSIHSANNLIASNLIINPGNFEYYEHGNTSFKGIDSYIMFTSDSSDVTMKTNYFSKNADNVGLSGSGYTLLANSPLIDAADSENKGITFDFYHNPRPYGLANDIGAFEFNPECLNFPEFSSDSIARPLLFPNPVKTWLTIQCQCKVAAEITLCVFDLQGKKLIQKCQPACSEEKQTIVLNTAALSPGIYIYQLIVGNETVSGKFVKVD
jgi:hypothetical protein